LAAREGSGVHDSAKVTLYAFCGQSTEWRTAIGRAKNRPNVLRASEGVHAPVGPHDGAFRVLGGRRKGGDEVLADVLLRERVQIPSLKGDVLDHRPVQRFPLFPQYLHGGFEVVHGQSFRAEGMTPSANTASIDSSYTAKGIDAAERIISSTPSAANSPTRSIT
jgi:hypothetical protein